MSEITTQIILIVLTAIGGGFFGAILIQMLTVLDPERGLQKTKKFRPDFESVEDVKEELKIEMLNAILFANDEVIKSMAEFSKNPNHEHYIKSAAAMRRDLWGTKTNIDEKTLGIFSKI